MLFFGGVLCLLLATASAENCFTEMVDACSVKGGTTGNCTSLYGAIQHVESNLQEFANANLQESFHLLLISSYFGNFQVNREGFKKLYRQYSDKLWEDAIDVMKYISKRGGSINFSQPSHLHGFSETSLEEIKSLAITLDHQKTLAEKAFQIHSSVSSKNSHNSAIPVNNDPAIAHYIEERFLEVHTERIQEMSGYINELKNNILLAGNHTPMSIFLFDEFLQKTL